MKPTNKILLAIFFLPLNKKMLSYLALGDSYTIGESVLLHQSFPYQTTQLLRKEKFQIAAPEIIAKTGWTTDELDEQINTTTLLNYYDIVTLLIGVNNQYRGRNAKNFEIEFEHLLQRAIQFANNKPNQVFVLSIPDWGVTPFAEGRERKKIAEEIDIYNLVCEKASEKYKTNFINITEEQRKDGNNPAFLAPDGLHPSALEYKKWANQLAQKIKTVI